MLQSYITVQILYSNYFQKLNVILWKKTMKFNLYEALEIYMICFPTCIVYIKTNWILKSWYLAFSDPIELLRLRLHTQHAEREQSPTTYNIVGFCTHTHIYLALSWLSSGPDNNVNGMQNSILKILDFLSGIWSAKSCLAAYLFDMQCLVY